MFCAVQCWFTFVTKVDI